MTGTPPNIQQMGKITIDTVKAFLERIYDKSLPTGAEIDNSCLKVKDLNTHPLNRHVILSMEKNWDETLLEMIVDLGKDQGYKIQRKVGRYLILQDKLPPKSAVHIYVGSHKRLDFKVFDATGAMLAYSSTKKFL